MPIEPTSVSKPVIREVEKASGGNLWNAMHGSSTGGKDSPFSSIWDKTVHGAQKLLGLDKSESKVPQDRDEDNEKERAEREPGTVAQTALSHNRFGVVPGFGSARFGGLGARSAGDSAFGSVSITRSQSVGNEVSFSKSDALGEASLNKSQAEPKGVASHENEPAVKARPESSNRSDEADTAEDRRVSRREPDQEAKSAGDKRVDASRPAEKGTATTAAKASPSAPMPIVAAHSPAPAVSELASQPTAQSTQQTTPMANPGPNNAGEAIGANANPGPNNTGEAIGANANPQSQLRPEAPRPATVPSEGSGQQGEKVAQAPKTNAPVAPSSVGAQASETAKVVKTPGPVTDSTATSKPVVDSAAVKTRPTAEVSEEADERLSINADKSKENISEALKRSSPRLKAEPSAPASSSASQANGLNPVSSEKAAARPAVAMEGVRIEGTPTTAGKSDLSFEPAAKEATSSEAKAASAPVNQRGGQSSESVASTARAQFAENLVKGSEMPGRSQNANTQGVPLGSVVRDAARPTTPNAQNRGNAQGPATVAGTAGPGAATLASATGNAANAQSQNGSAGDSGKQDFTSQLKGSMQARAGEKTSGDSGQAFDVKSSGADSSRKSAAASKAGQTSYVSKTADEVKEVVATLTKSIDRLVSTKAGTMNMRINFDQGGSMTIRIVMDGSQVSANMQTDVAGLEGMIKANWSELANDWNQKGVKLNAPQFQASSSAQAEGDLRGDSWNELSQKQQERQANGFNGSANSGSGRQGSGGSPDSSQSGAEHEPGVLENGTELESNGEVISDTELKTYA